MGPKAEAKLVKETEARIRSLRGLEKECFAMRKRDWYVQYLEAAFNYRLEIKKRPDDEQKVIRRVLRLHWFKKPKKVKKRSLFRRILDATTKSPDASKSRWTLGLKYILLKRKEMKKVGFAAFLAGPHKLGDEFVGGIVGCELKWREFQNAKKAKAKKDVPSRVVIKSPVMGKGLSDLKKRIEDIEDEPDDDDEWQ